MDEMATSFRVLHVDDDPGFLDLVADFLSHLDDRFIVQSATSATEGIDRLDDDDTYDCIVSDYDMPEQNGIEFLRTVRDDHPELPFILFTGKGSEEVASEAISADVTDYVQKSRSTDQYELLANRIRNAIDRRRSKQEVQRTQQRYETLVTEATDVIITVDENGKFTYLSPASERVLGYRAEELTGENGFEYIHPDDREEVFDLFDEMVVDAERRPTAEFRFRVKDGSWCWIEVRGRNLVDNPTVEGLVVYARDVSDRKERERALEESEDRYRSLTDDVLDTSRVGTFILDDGFDVVWINEAVEEYFGIDRNVVVGESKQELITESLMGIFEEPDAFAEAVFATYRDNTCTEQFECHVLPDDDREERWLEHWSQPIESGLYEGGRIEHYTDITDRVEREQSLEQYQRLVETMGDAVYALDVDGYITNANEAAVSLTGYSRGNLIGEHISLVLNQADIDQGNSLIRSLLGEDTDGGATYEVTVTTASGDRVPCEVRLSILPPADDGSFRGSVGVVRDISEREERERKLLESHELVDALSSTFPDYTFVFNESGEYLDVITGWQDGPVLYTVDELVGKTVDDVLTSDVAEQIHEVIQQTLSTNELQTIEYPIESPVGTRWYEGYAAPLSEGYNGERAVVLSARNVTKRRQREDRLHRQNERLDEFASIISHDLRNPLNVAVGNLELLREEQDSDRLRTALSALSRAEGIIEDTLRLARDGQDIDETESVKLQDIVEECWQHVPTGTNTLQIRGSGELLADRERFAQLLENLIRNAVQHGGEGVTVRIGRLPNGFFLEDDGPGIPKEEREKVLSPGYSNGDGTGFGLSIVRQIADAHGWEMSISTAATGGARFEFTSVDID